MTDLQMLRSLLSLPSGKLKQRQAFQAMYDSLVVGGVIGLSKKQRAWVAQVFAEHKLENVPVPRKVATLDKGVTVNVGPLPKKPPGVK